MRVCTEFYCLFFDRRWTLNLFSANKLSINSCFYVFIRLINLFISYISVNLSWISSWSIRPIRFLNCDVFSYKPFCCFAYKRYFRMAANPLMPCGSSGIVGCRGGALKEVVLLRLDLTRLLPPLRTLSSVLLGYYILASEYFNAESEELSDSEIQQLPSLVQWRELPYE